jgi:hypothetical protein
MPNISAVQYNIIIENKKSGIIDLFRQSSINRNNYIGQSKFVISNLLFIQIYLFLTILVYFLSVLILWKNTPNDFQEAILKSFIVALIWPYLLGLFLWIKFILN